MTYLMMMSSMPQIIGLQFHLAGAPCFALCPFSITDLRSLSITALFGAHSQDKFLRLPPHASSVDAIRGLRNKGQSGETQSGETGASGSSSASAYAAALLAWRGVTPSAKEALKRSAQWPVLARLEVSGNVSPPTRHAHFSGRSVRERFPNALMYSTVQRWLFDNGAHQPGMCVKSFFSLFCFAGQDSAPQGLCRAVRGCRRGKRV